LWSGDKTLYEVNHLERIKDLFQKPISYIFVFRNLILGAAGTKPKTSLSILTDG